MDRLEEIKQLDLEFLVVPWLNKSGLDGDRLLKEWEWLISEIETLRLDNTYLQQRLKMEVERK